jgi:hypothetical protein
MMLIKWSELDEEDVTFSVYRTTQQIELRRGTEQRENARLITSYKSYQDGYDFAELLAAQSSLLFEDFVIDH